METISSPAGSSEILSVLARYPDAGEDQLIALLQDVQDLCGYLSRDAIVSIGRHMDLPAIKVFGVATFYNQFRFHPLGKIHIQLCRGTACHVKGSKNILQQLEKHLAVPPGITTRDGMFSYETLACIGACGLAPAMIINDELKAKVDPDAIPQLLQEYRQRLEAL
jgi:NADH-quinone oxidoreductase subunit E